MNWTNWTKKFSSVQKFVFWRTLNWTGVRFLPKNLNWTKVLFFWWTWTQKWSVQFVRFIRCFSKFSSYKNFFLSKTLRIFFKKFQKNSKCFWRKIFFSKLFNFSLNYGFLMNFKQKKLGADRTFGFCRRWNLHLLQNVRLLQKVMNCGTFCRTFCRSFETILPSAEGLLPSAEVDDIFSKIFQFSQCLLCHF